MRVLLVHNRYRSINPSGENQAVDQEADLLAQNGHEVILYQQESDQIRGFTSRERASLPVRVVWSRSDRRAVSKVMANARPDVVHIHNLFPLISPSILGACSEAGVRTVVTLHNFRLSCANALLFRDAAPCELCIGHLPWPGVAHGCYRGSRAATVPIAAGIVVHRALRTWRRHVSAFIALSEFAKDRFVASGLPAERIHVVPNFVYPPAGPPVDAGDHVVFIGRISEEKGIDLLAKAWSRRFGRLVVMGDGPDRAAIESLMRRHGNSVEFTGRLSHDACMEILARARALVVPSKCYEGLPLVIPEAYARSVPVVASALGGLAEIVNPGTTGQLFAPGSAEDLALALTKVLGPGGDRLRTGARECYDAQYSPQARLSALLTLYRVAPREAVA